VREADVEAVDAPDPHVPKVTLRRARRTDPLEVLKRAGTINAREREAGEKLRDAIEQLQKSPPGMFRSEVHVAPQDRVAISERQAEGHSGDCKRLNCRDQLSTHSAPESHPDPSLPPESSRTPRVLTKQKEDEVGVGHFPRAAVVAALDDLILVDVDFDLCAALLVALAAHASPLSMQPGQIGPTRLIPG
jgi:hypothetical protein